LIAGKAQGEPLEICFAVFLHVSHFPLRHHRAWPGDPRLFLSRFRARRKSWIRGSSPRMTGLRGVTMGT